ncbi:ribbon-helix-helix domain-containing protein [soil metagenome]
MHFNIYIDDETGLQLNHLVKNSHRSRNALIREAIEQWLQQKLKPQWPNEVLQFKGVKDYPPFESHRDQLLPPKNDPLT